jgi:hypothetical protein
VGATDVALINLGLLNIKKTSEVRNVTQNKCIIQPVTHSQNIHSSNASILLAL